MSQIDTSTSPRGGSIGSALQGLASKWGWFVALGVLYIVAGLLAMGSLVTATVVSVLFVGAMMTLSGIGEVIAAFQMRSWGHFALWLALGLIYIAGGVIAFSNPLLAATSLTLLLGLALVVGGAIRIYLAMQVQQAPAWQWVLASGIITLVLGGMILARWPVSALYTLGIFLSVDLIFAGLGWTRIGMTIRRLTDGK